MVPFVEVVRVVLREGASFSPSQRLVALAVADRLREQDGRVAAWPGVADIVKRTGLSERSVRAALAGLVRGGMFGRERRSSRGGRLSDLLVLTLGNRQEIPLAQPARAATCATGNKRRSNRHQLPLQQQRIPNEPPMEEIPSESLPVAPALPSTSSWSREACDDWNERFGRGSAQGGRIGKALAPLIEAHGWPKVRPAWKRYLAQKDPQYASPNDFAAKFGAWTEGAPAAKPASGQRPTQGERNMAVVTRFIARGGGE